MGRKLLDLELNDRERTRFAQMFRDLAKEAEGIAKEIEAYVNDEIHEAGLAFHMLTLGVALGQTNEFRDLFLQCLKQQTPDGVLKAVDEHLKETKEEGTNGTSSIFPSETVKEVH